MISICPLAPCIKHSRDMLEVYSSRAYEEWFITRQVTHRRRGNLLDGLRETIRRSLQIGGLLHS